MPDTLAAPATLSLEVKHSRFIAHAAPAATPEAALAFVAQVSDADATHNCWAYRIGHEYRSSDAAEPAGTAGRPILAAIDGQGCDQVIVVVTRFFGGIKLGAGGLARAYGGAAAECLRTAQRRALLRMRDVELLAPFDALGTVHAVLAQFPVEKRGESFDEHGAKLQLRLPAEQAGALKTRLRDATRDRVRFNDAQDPGHA